MRSFLTSLGVSSMLHITFEFVGGPNDGQVLEGALGEASDAERCYLFTNHGAVGQRFKVASEYSVEALANDIAQDEPVQPFRSHQYVVTGRLEDEDQVWVRAEYLSVTPR